MAKVGDIYLSDDGGVLLHGDYYPGSWLKTDAGFRVIDPEFCFLGPPEFDLGVLAAHWIFCGGPTDRSAIDLVIQGSNCLLYTSPSPRDRTRSRMPSSA